MRMTEQEKFGLAVLVSLNGMRHSMIAHLFEMSVGRMFIKWSRGLPNLPDGSASFDRTRVHWAGVAQRYLDENADDITHISDWLMSAWLDAYPWLLRQDDQHRPLKLMKCGTLERLVHEADKAEARLHQQSPHFLSLTSKDERYVADLGAGYTLVQLLSPAALDHESHRMRHCIGYGAYDEDLLADTARYFSVRDEDGFPRATLEIVPKDVNGSQYGQIKQFQGRRNSRPDDHVVDLVHGVMESMRWIEKPKTKASATLICAMPTPRTT